MVYQSGFARLRRGLGRLLAADGCLLCAATAEAGSDLCVDCSRELPRNSLPCRRCALPLPGPSGTAGLCGGCLSRTPSFDGVHAPFLYRDSIRALILAFKQGSRLHLGPLLAQLMMPSGLPDPPQLLLPVPPHREGLRRRGFCQAAELARHLAGLTAIPVAYSALQRTRETPTQASQGRRGRIKAANRSFRAQGPLPARVAVIDDVMTTGATADAVADALKSRGVTRVDVWVLARTPLD